MLLIRPATAPEARPSCSTKGARSASLRSMGSAQSKVMLLMRTAMGGHPSKVAPPAAALGQSAPGGAETSIDTVSHLLSAQPVQTATDVTAVSPRYPARRSVCDTPDDDRARAQNRTGQSGALEEAISLERFCAVSACLSDRHRFVGEIKPRGPGHRIVREVPLQRVVVEGVVERRHDHRLVED